jgi:hypothetical protein
MSDFSKMSDEELEEYNHQLMQEKDNIREIQLSLNRELTGRHKRGVKKVYQRKGHRRAVLTEVSYNDRPADEISVHEIQSGEEVDRVS